MFCCNGKKYELKEQQKQSQAIDGMIAQDSASMRQQVRMLLLGPGESGKTTIIKQMKILHQGGYTDDERADFRLTIFRNILEAAKILIGVIREFDIPFENAEIGELCDYIVDYSVNGETGKQTLDKPFIEAVASLWSDSSASKALKRSNEYYL